MHTAQHRTAQGRKTALHRNACLGQLKTRYRTICKEHKPHRTAHRGSKLRKLMAVRICLVVVSSPFKLIRSSKGKPTRDSVALCITYIHYDVHIHSIRRIISESAKMQHKKYAVHLPLHCHLNSCHTRCLTMSKLC